MDCEATPWEDRDLTAAMFTCALIRAENCNLLKIPFHINIIQHTSYILLPTLCSRQACAIESVASPSLPLGAASQLRLGDTTGRKTPVLLSFLGIILFSVVSASCVGLVTGRIRWSHWKLAKLVVVIFVLIVLAVPD